MPIALLDSVGPWSIKGDGDGITSAGWKELECKGWGSWSEMQFNLPKLISSHFKFL